MNTTEDTPAARGQDQRYLSIRSRLEKLTNEQLQSIIDSKEMCLDGFNYSKADHLFCPIATAFDIPRRYATNDLAGNSISNQIVRKAIEEECLRAGFEFASVKGIPGNFYRDNREADIKGLCREIIDNRRRAELIHKKVYEGDDSLSDEERKEFEYLQKRSLEACNVKTKKGF